MKVSDFLGCDQKKMIRSPCVVHDKAKAPRALLVPNDQLEPEVKIGVFRVAFLSVVVRVLFQLPTKAVQHCDKRLTA